MALDIDRYRHAGDVAGKGLHVDGQGGNPAPVAHGADTQLIDPFQDIGLQRRHLARSRRIADVEAENRRLRDALVETEGRLGAGRATT